MRSRMAKLTEALFFCGRPQEGMNARGRARCLQRSLFVIMLVLTAVPLGVITGLSLFQYRELLQEEVELNARWGAENTKQTIEAFLGRLQSSVLFVAESYEFEELRQKEKLAEIFLRFKKEHPGVVDLSVIDQDGIQHAYVGPFDLAGKNYSGSPWFNQAFARRVFVSDVFLGFRKIPHFVVAVSKSSPDGNRHWVLRASLDASTLDGFLAAITPESTDDIFLLNSEGKLQTISRFYGGVGTVLLGVQAKKRGVQLSREKRGGREVLRAVGEVDNTPWVLVVEQQGSSERRAWLVFRNQLALLFGVCLLLVAFCAHRIARFLANNIRAADEAREAMLCETEHTAKLASIGRLAAGVAHEINNPLSIIGEKAGLMQDLLEMSGEFPHRQRFHDSLASLQKAVGRSRTITHRLLGFARRMEVSLRPVQLNDTVSEVLGFIEKEALYQNIRLELDLQPGLPTINSDCGQLQQIFLNIVNNAMDAVGRDGIISINTKSTGQAVQVAIADNGPGIPPELLKNIFEPFFTTKSSPEKMGTGLGLAITYGLVKKLGGDIEVESEPGRGTIFRIIFPLKTGKKEHGNG